LTSHKLRRTELRRPALGNGDVSKGHNGASEIRDCDHPSSNAGTLRTTLVWLDRSEYAVGDLQKFEVRIENVGSRPINIPFSPHLADLQPQDAGQKFGFSELTVKLWIGGARWDSDTGGSVTLYGA
jgi:hypothetical protein